MDGLFQREVSGQKVILPVWLNISRDEVTSHSPILAGRKAALWSSGLESVVADILRAVRGTTSAGSAAAPPAAGATGSSNLVLGAPGGDLHFFNAERRVRSGGRVELGIRPRTGEERAILRDSRREWHLAYDDEAHVVVATNVRTEADRTGDRAQLTFEIAPPRTSLMESSYNGISADEIAEMRARLILFAEPPTDARVSGNDSMLESFVAGRIGRGALEASPIAVTQLRGGSNSEAEFLARFRLVGVLLLVLSGAVEHVLRFELDLAGKQLRVRFEGRRAEVYMNQAPTVLRVEGQRPIAD
ncbi:MAG: hypothetical protein ABI782_07420 [Anaerolineaceae bacterium]